MLVATAFVAGLIKFLPASIVEARLNEALPAPWNMVVNGTLWDGQGVLRAGKSPDSPRIPVTWKFDPAALLRLSAAWDIASTSPAISGTVNVGKSWRAVEIRNAALAFDAAALAPIHPLLALAAPSGILQIFTPPGAALSMQTHDSLRMNGEVQIEATGFSVRPLSPALPGNYNAKLTTQDSRIDYTVSQKKGALNMAGSGNIDLARRSLSYSGLINPAPDLPEALLAHLKSIGKAEPDGRLRLDWKTQW
jgi:hypothetical protein